MSEQAASVLETSGEVVATAANPTPTPAEDKYVGFWTRLIARLIDILLLAIVMGVVGSVVSVGLQAFYPNHTENERMLFEHIITDVQNSRDSQITTLLSNFARLYECDYANNSRLQQACEQVRSHQHTTQITMSFLSFIAYTLYFVLYTASSKQGTLGKQLLNIKVVDEAGNKVTYAQAAMREIFALGNYICNLLGYIIGIFNLLSIGFGLGSVVSTWFVLFDEKKQALHDKIAKTYVVRCDNLDSM